MERDFGLDSHKPVIDAHTLPNGDFKLKFHWSTKNTRNTSVTANQGRPVVPGTREELMPVEKKRMWVDTKPVANHPNIHHAYIYLRPSPNAKTRIYHLRFKKNSNGRVQALVDGTSASTPPSAVRCNVRSISVHWAAERRARAAKRRAHQLLSVSYEPGSSRACPKHVPMTWQSP